MSRNTQNIMQSTFRVTHYSPDASFNFAVVVFQQPEDLSHDV